jgi:hypothetical protein
MIRLSSRKVVLLLFAALLAALFSLRFESLTKRAPYYVEVWGYSLWGSDRFLSPVFLKPLDSKESVEIPFEYTYRGSKILCLFFDKYDAHSEFAGNLISDARVVITKGGVQIYKQSITPGYFQDAYLLAEGKRALILDRIDERYTVVDTPLLLKVEISGWNQDVANRLGKVFIAIANDVDY